MKLSPIASLALFLAACSSPTETATKTEPKKAPEPLSGRQAIQATFPTARTWAPDAQLFRARNYNLPGYPSSQGKAVAWEITYVSPAKASMRSYSWSAVELGSVHEGVYGGPQQSWRQGREAPIDMSQLGVDTTDLLKAAEEAAAEYLKRPGEKPPVTYQLESNPRFTSPSWAVMWGNTPGTAQYVIYLDAKSGKLLGRN